MRSSYIQKTCAKLIAIVLSIFTIVSCCTIKTVSADYIEEVSIDIIDYEKSIKTQLDSVKEVLMNFIIEQTLFEINETVQLIEDELTLVQESFIVEELNETVWTITSLRLRSEPVIDNNIVDLLRKGTKLTRIGICQNGWSQVKYNDEIYYMHSDYLTTEEPVIVKVEAVDKGTYQTYALSLFDQYGWSEAELEPLIILWTRESNWNPLAENKKSGAYGIPQSYPGDKMSKFGDDWKTNYKTQIQWGLWYIDYRYGTPTKALEHSYSTGWY